MRAAVIRRSGATPALDQFDDPQPGQGLSVGTLVAAALNPLDVLIVNDQLPFRRLQPPCIAGYEAVVQLGDGTRCYMAGPPAPYGTLAELVPVPDSAGCPGSGRRCPRPRRRPRGGRAGRMGGARPPRSPADR